jgi:RimJ/RimL family protein N-acetyltransferase
LRADQSQPIAPAPGARGRGLATAALAELAAEISERPLHAWVVSSNVGSIRVLEKCGFGEIERRAEQDEHAGG